MALSLTVFSFKDHAYSKNDVSDVPFESSPQGIAINPETNIAVIVIEREGHHYGKSGIVSVIDLETQQVISTITVGREGKTEPIFPIRPF